MNEHMYLVDIARLPIKSGSVISHKDEDAVAFLMSNHHKIKVLFKTIEKISDDPHKTKDKMALIKKVCGDLLIHMAVEEEIFYPPVRLVIDDNDLMNEACVEHEGVKELIRQLDEMAPSDPIFDATVKVLREYVEYHFREEEDDMFLKARMSDLDLVDLGEQLIAATQKMHLEHGLVSNA